MPPTKNSPPELTDHIYLRHDSNQHLMHMKRVISLLGFSIAFLFQTVAIASQKVPLSIENFPFGYYSVGYGSGDFKKCGPILKSLKLKGISIAGPYYGAGFDPLKNECYRMASQLSLPIIHYVTVTDKKSGKPASFVNTQTSNAPESPSAVETDVENQLKQLRDLGLVEKISMWGVMPEELRSWRRNEMEYLQTLIAAIRASEKKWGYNRLPIMMYEPGNRTTKLLSVTGEYLDVQVIGTYTKSNEESDSLKIIKNNTNAVVAASQVNGTAPMVALALSKNFQPYISKEQIRENIRRRAYVALAEGAKGILIWSWATRSGLSVESRDIQAAAYSSVAEDLNGQLQLGKVFLHGKSSNGAFTENPNVLIRAKEMAGEFYIIAINLSDAPQQINAKNMPKKDGVLRNIFQTENFAVKDGIASFALPGAAVSIFKY